MIVVVIGVALVLVHEILAEEMVGERVALLLVLSHSNLLLATRNACIRRMLLWHGQFAAVKMQVI